jgi:hypothetical protein
MSLTPLAPLPVSVPASHGAGVRAVVAAPQPASPASLSAQAAPTFAVLQAGAGLPPSANPAYVLPASAQGFLRLFAALQAVAVERIYPAPVFSFQA